MLFGDSRRYLRSAGEHTADVGTYLYLAPEVIHALGGYGKACDVYSFAVLINEMAGRKVPWAQVDIRNPLGRKLNILNRVEAGARPELTDGRTPEFEALVTQCWAHDPQARPSFGEVIDRLQGMGSFISV